MDIGIHYADFSQPGGAAAIPRCLGDTARAAEDVGAAWFTVMDHWFQMEQLGGPEAPMLEGYTTLGYVAALTERIRLGLLVTGVTYRHPGLLAKTVTTLDVLSGGRAMLGIGAAWYEREHQGLGVPFPPLRERFERLEETLRICRQMWGEDDGAYEGRHYRLTETRGVPGPVSAPHPPILIGGSGERRTLRLVAEHADACNLFGEAPEVIAHKIEVLRGHCADVGRDPAQIQVTVIAGSDPLADVDGFLATADAYAALGVSHVQVMPTGDDPVAWVEQVGERIVPRLAEVGPR